VRNELVQELEALAPPGGDLPILSVSRGQYGPMVAARFPAIPGFTCDSWCYESAMEYLGSRRLEGGGLELHHRTEAMPAAVVVTSVTPHPEAVEVLARVRLEPGAAPQSLPAPNLCWQLKRAATFASAGAHYTEFVRRCFIFTPGGRTFLDQTDRKPVPPRPGGDAAQLPFPWVQMYLPVGAPRPEVTPRSWSDYSDTRYVTRVIGAVSTDSRHLAALANGTATTMSQAWHDCMHNNPAWHPADAPLPQRTWRLRIYAMANDPASLLERVRQDFGPEA